MASDLLNLDFRRTHSLYLSHAIKQYISTKYDQHPDQFSEDLAEIDQLRRNAITVREPHTMGIKRIQAYAAQLVWMAGKFPIDIGADFVWYPSLGYAKETPNSQNNIRFELANVLFNLGVLYCQLATSSNRSTPDGLKLAYNYYCQAAGIMSHLRSTVIPEMRSTAPDDMDDATLECLERLFLAQGLECFWQRAIKDGLKDTMISKLAAKVSDIYSEASDFGVKSDAISSEWIHHMTAKHHHFAAAAQYRAALDCLETCKYGEEVARLRDSLVCANEGLKESRYVNQTIVAHLNSIKSKVQDDLKTAEKDNDVIYLEVVPTKAELSVLPRSKGIPEVSIPPEVSQPIQHLSDDSKSSLGKPLFTKLVPYSVHMAASVYASRRDQTVNNLVDELQALTQRIHDLLRSLKLPGSLQALEKPLGLPPAVMTHSEELRQENAPDRLKRTVADIDSLKLTHRRNYEESISVLRSENEEDQQARTRYGTDRWSRPDSRTANPGLFGKAEEVDNFFKGGDAADKDVRNRIQDEKPMIKLLASEVRKLEEWVPSSRRTVMTPGLEKQVSRLRAAIDDLRKLESKRAHRIEALRAKGETDDVTPDLLREAARLEREQPMQPIAASQFEGLFDDRLIRRYDSEKNVTRDDTREQRDLLSKVAEANTSFNTARRGDDSSKQREKALQKLENAYSAYKSICNDLETGRKFYNDLGPIVTKFKDDCREFAFKRRNEARAMEEEITTAIPMANLNISGAHNGLQQQQQSQKAQAQFSPTRAGQNVAPSPRRSSRIQSHSEAPLAAPKPVKPAQPLPVAAEAYGSPTSPTAPTSPAGAGGPSANVWNPEMPITFAGMSVPNESRLRQSGVGMANGQQQQQQQQQPPQNKTWDPSKGMNFSPY